MEVSHAANLWPSLTERGLLPQVIECDILKRLGLRVLLAYLRGEGVHAIRSQARRLRGDCGKTAGDDAYVRSWLSSAFPPGHLQIPVYCQAFVAGGWCTRVALKRIEKEDLDKMGVKEGHARMILLRLKQE
jgi:hypothetical protein